MDNRSASVDEIAEYIVEMLKALEKLAKPIDNQNLRCSLRLAVDAASRVSRQECVGRDLDA